MQDPPSSYRITIIPETDDSTLNMRVSTALKKDFSVLCKKEHLSVATALKRYMARCVSKGRIVN